MKKLLSLLLIFVLTLSCFNLSVKAATLSGEGTKENPYVITSADDLNEVRKNLSAYYILNNDIDLSGEEDFMPIGNSSSPFLGNFNGNGKKITGLNYNFNGYAYDIYIDTPKEDDDGYITGGNDGWTGDYEIGGTTPEVVVKIPKYVGLFGVNSGKIYDLHIENATITATALNDEIYVGLFAGVNKGEIYRCYATVSNISSYAKKDYCGTFAGKNETGGIIGNCFTNINVSANLYAGGITAYNSGYVACTYYNGYKVDAKNCDAICNNAGSMQYNYYLSGLVTSVNATQLSKQSFAYSSYFTGFNFSSVWQINSTLKQPVLRNNPYPVKTVGETPPKPTIEKIDGTTISFVTDGSLLFSNDGVNFTYNNLFTQEYGTTVKYYAKRAETVDNYQSASSEYLEVKIYKKYDINGDDEETSKDLTQLRRYLADWDVTVITENLDVNNDDEVDGKDATYLARYQAGWYN